MPRRPKLAYNETKTLQIFLKLKLKLELNTKSKRKLRCAAVGCGARRTVHQTSNIQSAAVGLTERRDI